MAKKDRERAMLDAKLQAVVRFTEMLVSENLSDAEHAAMEQHVNRILGGTVTAGLAFVSVPDFQLSLPGGPVVRVPLLELQNAVRALLSDIVDDRRVKNPGARPVKNRYAVTLTLDVIPQTPPERHLLSIGGSFRNVFLATVCQLLALSPTQRILRCSNCQRLFYRIGRQTHCSKACYNAYYWRDGYPADKKLRARRKEYKKYGWKLGARSKKRTRVRRSART